MTSVLTSAAIPTLVSRRRALTALVGVAALGLAGSARAAAQEGAGSGPAGVRTAQDAAGPVVVANASGSASAPADRVLIQLIARSADSYGGGMPEAPVEGTDEALAAGPTADALQAAVTVLTEAGVDEEKILVVASEGSIGSSFFGLGSGMIGAELSKRQLKLLPDLLSDASAALTGQGLLVDQPMAIFLADGCVDLRADALAAAVEAARADANALAKALGVKTTTLHRATELGYSYGPYAYVGGPSDACNALPELADLPRTYLSTYDPTAPLEFTVVASLELIMNVE